MKAYRFTGTFFIAPVLADGSLSGSWRRGGNMYPLNVKVETEKKSQKSMEHDRAGQTLAVATQISDITANATLRQLDSRAFAWAVSGEATEMSGSGGTIAAADYTALAVGDYLDLPHENLTSVVVENSAQDITYIKDVDYLLDEKLGLLAIPAGGDISESDAIKISYDHAAPSGYRVSIGTKPLIRVALKGHLKETYSGDEMSVLLRSVVLTAPDGINLISELDAEYEEVPVEMSLETPTGYTNPGTIDGVPL